MSDEYTVPFLILDLETAISEARTLKPSRELSLVITKLQEALHWAREIVEVTE